MLIEHLKEQLYLPMLTETPSHCLKGIGIMNVVELKLT